MPRATTPPPARPRTSRRFGARVTAGVGAATCWVGSGAHSARRCSGCGIACGAACGAASTGAGFAGAGRYAIGAMYGVGGETSGSMRGFPDGGVEDRGAGVAALDGRYGFTGVPFDGVCELCELGDAEVFVVYPC